MARNTPCSYCGALVPFGSHVCIICGAGRGHKPAVPSVKSGPEKTWDFKNSGTAGDMRRPWRRLTAFLMAAVMLLVLSGGGVAFHEYTSYLQIVSTYTSSEAILFTSEDSLYIYFPALGEPRAIAEVSSAMRLGRSPLTADASADQRFVAYLNSRSISPNHEWMGDLYLLDLASLSAVGDESAGGLHLASNVVYFRFLPGSDRLLLLTSGGDLYLYDYSALKEPFRVLGPEALRGVTAVQIRHLDRDVRGIGSVSGRYLLYYKGESANTLTWQESVNSDIGNPFDLYIINLENELATPIQIAQRVHRVHDSTGEFERIIFTQRTRPMPQVSHDVHVFHRSSGESELLASGVRHVVDTSAALAAALVLLPSDETLSFRDIINDDLHDSDFAMSMPHWQDYIPPPPEDDENFEGYTEEQLEEFFLEFDRDFALYEQMLAREWMRRSLRDDLRSAMQRSNLSFTLEYVTSADSLRIADRIYNRGEDISALVWGDIESGDVLFVRGERESLRQITMSELTHEQVLYLTENELDIARHLTEHMPEILWHTQIGGEARELFIESGTRQISRFLMVGGGVYFSVMHGYMSPLGALYFTDLTGSGSVLYLDEYVVGYIGIAGTRGESLVYRRVTFGNIYSHDIMIATNGGAVMAVTLACPDTPILLLGDNDDIIAFNRTSQSGESSGTYIFTNGQERFISYSISDMTLHSSGLIYFIRYGRVSGLYVYRAGETTRLEGNIVDAVFLS